MKRHAEQNREKQGASENRCRAREKAAGVFGRAGRRAGGREIVRAALKKDLLRRLIPGLLIAFRYSSSYSGRLVERSWRGANGEGF